MALLRPWTVAVAVLSAICGYVIVSSPLDPVVVPSHDVAPMPTGAFPIQTFLNASKALYTDITGGGEAFAADKNGFVYTGTSEGRIIRLVDDDTWEHVAFTAPHRHLGDGSEEMCSKADIDNEPFCGRPLGLAFDKQGNLLVCDAYYGLMIFEWPEGSGSRGPAQGRILTDESAPDGRKVVFCNTPVEGPDGLVYFTDSSAKFRINRLFLELIESGATGALMSYAPSTKETRVLHKDLPFPNGMVVSFDETHLLINSCTRALIWKYHLTGSNKGKLEVFGKNYPTVLDNIRRSPRGTYWVGGPTPTAMAIVVSRLYPWIRKLMAGLPYRLLVLLTLDTLVGGGGGWAMEIDDTGKVLRLVTDPSSRVRLTTEAFEHNDRMYVGSFVSKMPIFVADMPSAGGAAG
mmetsp:Transcript_27628/g.79473  ORF Transcript_27628/g.79473 Transcript_27628/m.79473 type:complete len:404 (+) Transcript_27628:135-1346(+)